MNNKELYNDPLLLQEVANGNEEAFHKLVVRYQPYINAVAFRLTGDKAMAEDIVQDTFMKVWINRRTLPEKDNFGGWLYHVAANITHNAIKQINHHKKYQQYLQQEGTVSFALPSNITEQKEMEKILHQAVSLLPLRQKEAFQLIKLDGMSYKDAAYQLGVSRETVKSNLQLAVRFIRSYCIKMVNNAGDTLIAFIFLNFLWM